MFKRLGTPAQGQAARGARGGARPTQRRADPRKCLDWLDRYLGPDRLSRGSASSRKCLTDSAAGAGRGRGRPGTSIPWHGGSAHGPVSEVAGGRPHRSRSWSPPAVASGCGETGCGACMPAGEPGPRTHRCRSARDRRWAWPRLDGKVYVVGGFDGSRSGGGPRSRSYDPATDRWTQRASLPAPLHHVNVAAVEASSTSSARSAEPRSTAHRDDAGVRPGARRWAHPDLDARRNRARRLGRAVLGRTDRGRRRAPGATSVTDASVVRPRTNAWSPLQPLAVARDHLAAGNVGGRVYAVTGRAGGVLKAALEVLDASTGSWSRRADIPTARGGVAAAELSGRLGRPGRRG
jgi:hypothetical protein